MSLWSKLTISAAAIALVTGVTALFNDQSDTPRIPEHCADYQPSGDMTAIRFGAEPVDTHLWGRNTIVDNAIEDMLGINAGISGATNILYVEFGSTDSEGEFTPIRRIYAFEKDMQPFGTIIAGAYGSATLPFSSDPMYDDDPHETLCGQIQSANGNYFSPYLWPGDTQIVFEGTPEQVNQIYAESLQSVVEFNSLQHSFGLLGNNNPNGNSFFARLAAQINHSVSQFGGDIKEFNPRGFDFGINWEGEFSNPELDLPYDPAALEQIIADQIEEATSVSQTLPTAAPRPPA